MSSPSPPRYIPVYISSDSSGRTRYLWSCSGPFSSPSEALTYAKSIWSKVPDLECFITTDPWPERPAGCSYTEPTRVAGYFFKNGPEGNPVPLAEPEPELKRYVNFYPNTYKGGDMSGAVWGCNIHGTFPPTHKELCPLRESQRARGDFLPFTTFLPKDKSKWPVPCPEFLALHPDFKYFDPHAGSTVEPVPPLASPVVETESVPPMKTLRTLCVIERSTIVDEKTGVARSSDREILPLQPLPFDQNLPESQIRNEMFKRALTVDNLNPPPDLSLLRVFQQVNFSGSGQLSELL